MKLYHPAPDAAAAILAAMGAVVSAGGRSAPSPLEAETVAAIARHMFGLDEPPRGAPCGPLPSNLAEAVRDPAARRLLVRMLVLLPVVDGEVRPTKAAVAEEAARRLGVEDPGVGLLRMAARRQFRRMAWGIVGRSVGQYWSPTGKARLRDWFDVFRSAMPNLPALHPLLTDPGLLARYRALAAKPEGTMGRVLHDFYIRRGFPLPGEPKSFPEGWSKHEVFHVLGEYETSMEGEFLNAAFSAGNTETICMDLAMISLLQFHAEFQVMPGPKATGMLRPDLFFSAMRRGAAMRVDLFDRWSLWGIVDTPVEALRAEYGVPPLRAEERREMASWGALLAESGAA